MQQFKGLNSEIDGYDRKILEVLSRDGRISITDLSDKIGLSKTPCQIRLKRLLSEGFIEGFRAILNPVKLNIDHVAFAEVKLSDTREKALREFNRAVKEIPEIEACHMIAGRFDYLLKVRTRDIKRYRHVLGEKISSLPHVSSTSTNVVMQTIMEDSMGISDAD
ncbi:ArsR family transcriptional regulator [Agrobacterium tumefaciens]|nr:ArsR family transcriptional regulator [Agrobacterium tumefaciens]KAJ32852.1 ArsR family transcriptional regulator [Agrobacterium tumefaciens]